jgi:hypothetical protein
LGRIVDTTFRARGEGESASGSPNSVSLTDLMDEWSATRNLSSDTVNQEWRRRYIHLAMRRHKSIAKVALGRKLDLVLDVAQWLRVFAGLRVRFVRGTARYRTWCDVGTTSI